MKTKHVRNITDVDDKTIRDSVNAGMELADFTSQWRDKFHADCEALNCLKPHIEPSAVEHIPEQVAMIEDLLEKVTLMCQTTVRCILESLHFLNMGNYRVSINVSLIWGKPKTSELIPMNTKRITLLILFYGKIVVMRMVTTIGIVLGEKVGLAGILSARR
jgi:hypothetical protein